MHVHTSIADLAKEPESFPLVLSRQAAWLAFLSLQVASSFPCGDSQSPALGHLPRRSHLAVGDVDSWLSLLYEAKHGGMRVWVALCLPLRAGYLTPPSTAFSCIANRDNWLGL